MAGHHKTFTDDPKVDPGVVKKAFTAAIDRQENMEFIEELGVPFDEHVQRVLNAMQGVATELGVDGA